MKHLIQTLLLLLPWIVPATVTAQEDNTKSSVVTVENDFRGYCEGYIITLNNDTIYGLIRDNFPLQSNPAPKKVVLKDNNGVKIKCMPRDIKGYCKGGEVFYLTIKTGAGLRKEFARVIIDGEIKLLKIYQSGVYAYPMPVAGSMTMATAPYSYTNYYLYKTSTAESTKVTHLDFKDVMAVYFYDFEPLRQMILNKELRYDDLEIIVNKYNIWKEEQKE